MGLSSMILKSSKKTFLAFKRTISESNDFPFSIFRYEFDGPGNQLGLVGLDIFHHLYGDF